MDKTTLEERCAELKARMLAEQAGKRSSSTQILIQHSNHRPSSERQTPVQAEQQRVRLTNPHPLIKEALCSAENVPSDYGRLQYRRAGLIDIRVSKHSVRRALRVFDLLIKPLEQEGLRIGIVSSESGYYESFHQQTYVTNGTERVHITVSEKVLRRENPAWNARTNYFVKRYDYHPTGILTLALDEGSYRKIDSRRTWSDGIGHLIEDRIDSVRESIRQILKLKLAERIAAEERQRRERELQKLREEAQRQQKEEQERVDQLKTWSRMWSECERLRAFVAQWEQQTQAKHGPIECGSPADAWRRWALLAIDRLDPLRE